MTSEQFDALPSAQKKAMRDLQERSGIPWEDFVSQALAPTTLHNYVAIPNFHGMYVGIEEDGHTHS